MALNIKKVLSGRGHDVEYPGVLKDGDERSAGKGANGRVHDAAAKTLKCK